MESLQGERVVFYTRLHRKAEKRAIQHQPGSFYSQLQQPPCTERGLKARNGIPYKVKGPLSTLSCGRKQNGPSSTDQALSIPSCNSHHALSPRCTCPPPPVPRFLLVQNLSSKWISPTDNMRPNFDDDYSTTIII